MPEQTRLDLFRGQRLAQQRIAAQIDLADGEVVARPPPGVQLRDLVLVRSGEGPHQLLVVEGGDGVLRHGGHGRSFRRML
jgi:hypothetical protein